MVKVKVKNLPIHSIQNKKKTTEHNNRKTEHPWIILIIQTDICIDKNIFFYTFRTRNAPVRGTMFIHSEQQNAYSERYIKKGRLFILTFQSNEFCSFCTNSLDKKIINHFQQTPEL